MKESHEDTKARSNLEELSAIAVDCAYKLHVASGPESLNRTLYLWERARVWVRSAKVERRLVSDEKKSLKNPDGLQPKN